MTGRPRPFYKGRAREGGTDNCSGREKLQSANARIVNGSRCIELCRLTVDETRIQITDNEYLTNESADSFESGSPRVTRARATHRSISYFSLLNIARINYRSTPRSPPYRSPPFVSLFTPRNSHRDDTPTQKKT